jgi:hypothetical protein
MNVPSDEALCRYGTGQFTDGDVARCTGLSVRAWRELIKTRAVATITESQGRGYVRLCNHTVLKRAAVIAALNRAGLSLSVSGHVAYALPFRTLLYEFCDPWMIVFQRVATAAPPNGLPPRVKRPRSAWFNPNTPVEADRESDWVVNIYDGRFVGTTYDARDPPGIFGDLRNNGAAFVGWWPLRHRVPRPRMGRVFEGFLRKRPAGFLDGVREWESPAEWSKELKSLGYRFERHYEDRDPLCIAADASIRSPLVTTSVNVTLAIRKALRRYLDIEPVLSTSAPKSTRKVQKPPGPNPWDSPDLVAYFLKYNL